MKEKKNYSTMYNRVELTIKIDTVFFFRNRSLRLQRDPNSSQTKLCWQASKRHKSQDIQLHGLDSDFVQQAQSQVLVKI
jgi:hypothetical protein